MNWTKFFIAFIATWIFIFIFEWVFHGMLMHDSYAATSALWRPQTEISMPLLVAGQGVIAFFFTMIFVRGFGSGGGLGGGLRYGILLGLLGCGANIIQYAVQPLTTNILMSWCIGGVIEMAIAGLIVGALYKPGTAAA
jgi:hypothetical protein